MTNMMKKIIGSLLLFLLSFVLLSCDQSTKNATQLPDDITEDIINEDIINQVINEEIYLKEIIVVENKVSEMLIQDEKIEEVVLCKSIYINEENIDEFSKHSQTAELFGSNIDIEPLMAKISIGTGVILTLTILKVSNISGLFGGIVVSAAPKAIKGALSGAGIGSLIGAFTGTIDSIDETGRTTAVLNFAASVVGVIATAISMINAPLGIAIAGITVASGLAAFEGYKMVKAFTETDYSAINWNNVDWKKVGYSAAEQAINNAADGYVWGSVIGAVSGGLEGYKKFDADHSSYKNRLRQTPKEGNGGHWTGPRGESTFILDEPVKCKNGVVVDRISYKNAIPDFSEYSIGEVKINMTNSRTSNFNQADELLADYWSKIKYNGKSWTPREVSTFRSNNGYTWHEMNNMKTIQLVPTEVNGTFGHLGGVGEYNIMISQNGGLDFDK